jgi:ribosomal-protein-alanine N-acetyltransferase
VQPTRVGAVTPPAEDSTDVDHEDYARLCLDPVRLSALGRAAEGTLIADDLSQAMGISRRAALETIAALRLAGLLDDGDGLAVDALHTVASTLPKAEPASDAITAGDWTNAERKVLRTFFSGDSLTEIPAQRRKRLVVLERLAQEFEPGVRYDEVSVSRQLARYHEDYASLRRYLIEESLLSRADGEYWRTGGRFLDTIPSDGRSDEAARGEAGTATRGPVLDTRHPDVFLMPYSSGHREALVAAADDERITRHMADRFPHPYTDDDAAEWIAKCEAEEPPLSFAIMVDDALAGGVGCEPKTDIRSGTAEVGWWLTPARWGRGIAAVAVERFIEYCFDELGLHRVEAGVFVSNPASARVAEKAGFRLEGVSHDAYLKNGVLVDRLSYGLARSETDGPGVGT